MGTENLAFRICKEQSCIQTHVKYSDNHCTQCTMPIDILSAMGKINNVYYGANNLCILLYVSQQVILNNRVNFPWVPV